MPKDSFREKIAVCLEGMSGDDVCYFAWLCAVRALPFLGSKGSFEFWQDYKQQQIYLFALFRTLDSVSIREKLDNQYMDASSVSRANSSTQFVAYISAAIANASETNAAIVNGNINEGIYAAAATAYFADLVAGICMRTGGFKTVIMQDIEEIKSGNYLCDANILMYGECWDNFFDALKNINCEYWGEWYRNLFKNNFKLSDSERTEIFMRLNNPYKSIEYGAADIAEYIGAVRKFGNKRLNEMRILILGEKGAGKTSLARRLKNSKEQMPRLDESTAGVDIIDWNVSYESDSTQEALNIHIWDFAGHVITHAVHRCFMSERCLYILLINGRTEGDNRTEYWLEQIRNYGGNSPVLVVVNVKDDHFLDIPQNTLKKEFPSIVDFYQLNILEGGEALERLRDKIISLLQKNPLWKNQHISLPVFKVKEAICKYFDSGKELINYEEFVAIAKTSDVAENDYISLIQYLHDLGICMTYSIQNSTAQPILLDPKWISYGIYRLINYGLNQQRHILSCDIFSDVFAENDYNQYPQSRAKFLFALMAEYQLAFFLNGDSSIFVPLLLPIDRPDSTKLPQFPFGERLRMVYEANIALPPFSVARLAVLLANRLDVNASWRYGATFRMADTIAIVEENERMRTVTVTVKGEERTKLLSLLRDSLNSIFDEYKDNRPELKYEILLPIEWSQQEDRPHFPQEELKRFIQPEGLIIGNVDAGQKIVTGNSAIPLVDPSLTVEEYDIFSIQIFQNYCLKKIDEINLRLQNTANLTDTEIHVYEQELIEYRDKLILSYKYNETLNQIILQTLKRWYYEKKK